MRCKKCFNWTDNHCETMTEPFSDGSCFMTKAQRIKAERAIVKHTMVFGNAGGRISDARIILKNVEARNER